MNWEAILPIAVVTITGILALICEMIRPKHQNDLIVGVSLAGLVVAAGALVMQFTSPGFETFAETYVLDKFGTAIQLVIVLSAALCILFSETYLRNKAIAFGEFYPLVLWSAVGAMLMSATNNLLVLFLGLEILSVSLYVMAGLSRQEQRSEESAMKYFLLGAFASGFLLFGIAFVYGGTGSLNLGEIGLTWVRHQTELQVLVLFGLALMLVGLGFKASLVPFHQWTPDVYQGAPTNVAAFMATVSKIGALAALVRVLEAVAPLSHVWMPPVMVLAAITMLVGNLVALSQRDVRRILAYSSIAHAGYVLVAILAHVKDPGRIGTGAVTYYLFSYAFTTIGAFAVVSLAAKDGSEPTSIDDMLGLYKRSPIAAVALVVCMLSLIGIPPSGGFVGKLMIFNDAVSAGLTPLALVLAVSSAISIFYYLSIAIAACSDDASVEGRFAKAGPAMVGTFVICIAGILAAGVLAGPALDFLRLVNR
ncbi:MAG: NADH-quinone oxidoreductase subunit N [Fimbriimonas sp.]